MTARNDFEAGQWYSTSHGAVITPGWQFRWMDVASDWQDTKPGIFVFKREINENGDPRWFLKITKSGAVLMGAVSVRVDPLKREKDEDEPTYLSRAHEALNKAYRSLTTARAKVWTAEQEKHWLNASKPKVKTDGKE